MRITRLDWAAGLVAAIGVSTQFAQSEDPRFPLSYFTVLSATLPIVCIVSTLAGNNSLRNALSYASEGGCLVSALTYWTVIAPANGIGAETPTQISNIVLHLAVPGTVFLRAIFSRSAQPATRTQRLQSIWFPALYSSVIFGVQAYAIAPPYQFLDLRQSLVIPLITVPTIGLAYLTLGFLTDAMARRVSAARDDSHHT